MGKERKWQLFVILAVIALTVYNIFPTIFYYCKPLRDPIEKSQAEKIATSIAKRVDRLEDESIEWVQSFCDLIQVKPISISPDANTPELLSIQFHKTEEAARFQRYFPRSGSLIPFQPAQLSLIRPKEGAKELFIQRQIPIRLSKDLFSFVSLNDENYKEIAIDRAAEVAYLLTSQSESALYLKHLETGQGEVLSQLTHQINTLAQTFEGDEAASSKFLARFTQGTFKDRIGSLQTLVKHFDDLRDQIKKEKDPSPEIKRFGDKVLFAETYLKKHLTKFASGQDPFTLQDVKEALEEGSVFFGGKNPLFSELVLDLEKNQIALKWHPEVASFRENHPLFEQLVVDELAKISRLAEETPIETKEGVILSLTTLPNASSFLALNLEKVASLEIDSLRKSIEASWHPKHPDLQKMHIVTADEYKKLSPEERALSLVLYAPVSDGSDLFSNLSSSSIYLVAKGVDRILENYQQFPDSPLAKAFSTDFRNLSEILQERGCIGYFGSLIPGAPRDFLFEKRDFARALLKSTREEFHTFGTKKYALLEFSDYETRLLTENKIENQIHEDLLKWHDEYRTAQVSLNPHVRFDTPKPTRSAFWSNLALSMRKFFHGDDRKIIRWGLDLSGGKSVQLELRDQDGKRVTNELDLKQGMNELYNRVGKMGVSEVSIRSLGDQLVVDFPGSQAFSASQLIQASTMYFHVVNEKFSLQNSSLADSVNHFLQEVWNEATVRGIRDADKIHEIAREHLHGKANEPSPIRGEAAETLWKQGLRLASLNTDRSLSALDETLSRIALFRGDSPSDWHGQTHPLLVIFHNHAIGGAHLDNIRAGYEPSKGNYLSFDVKSSFATANGETLAPRDMLQTWTSRFSKEKVVGTPYEAPTHGRGWRMAVLLNNSVINAPTLDSPLRDSAMISGSFSQREVNQLASDLKAGSLTFTPHILSEKNVSPELGASDRSQGILATFIALLLVIGSMIAYYRFAGVVASVAVLFNLLVLWATLQNLGATLTLAGIAGIILTVGMAVDANVLVFERIKEEFALTKQIGSAIKAGYEKAFTAILDSNVTTVIAALILLNFDAGPIKSFAINLIIGIVSSMFTALFMTRFYFATWVQNPKNTTLTMASWFQGKRYNFLKKAKMAFLVATLITLIGGAFVYSERASIFGMDFTGGYALNLELDAPSGHAPLKEALLKAGLSEQEFQIREMDPPNHVRLLLSTTLEQEGKPFYNLPLETASSSFDFEKNPRISWVVSALKSSGTSLTSSSLKELHTSWTSMSGQMSDSMRNNALLGLLLSFISIFIYLAFRFEYKFAAAALLCLFHDVLLTLGLMGLLHKFGVPVQIDLSTVAALMTIIGYSLNDTIIIFDRIREEMHLMKGRPLSLIINHCLNLTLSRTSITSGTTLLVLIALTALGGSSIFSFSLVMAIGVFFGTLSSWFIAAPLMLFFHKREAQKEASVAQNS